MASEARRGRITALYTAGLVFKILPRLLLLPFFLLWALARFCRFKAVLKKNLVLSGMPGKEAKALARGMRLVPGR